MPLPPGQYSGAAGTVDPTGTYIEGFAGGGYLGDLFRLSLATGLLERIERTPRPPPLMGFSSVADPAGQRLFLFGGQYNYDPTTQLSDLWGLTWSIEPEWTQLARTGAPPAPGGRVGAAAVYDPQRDRVVILGGTSSGYPLTDVWAFELSNAGGWSVLSPATGEPPPRRTFGAICDTGRDRLLVFGAVATSATEADGVWAFSLSSHAWHRLTVAGLQPVGAYQWRPFFDPGGDRVLFFGPDSPSSTGALWELRVGDSPTWSRVDVQGAAPAWRNGYLGIWDAPRSRYIVMMGSTYEYDCHILDLGGTPTWSAIPVHVTSAPPPLTRTVSAYLPWSEQMVVAGGANWRDSYCSGYASPARFYFGAVSLLSLGDSPEWSVTSPATGFREDNASIVVDEPARKAIVFGGEFAGLSCSVGHTDRYYVPSNLLWQLTVDGPPTWTLLTASGAPPAPRADHAAIYDPARARMIVFGGVNRQPYPFLYYQDIWQLSLQGDSEWSPLTTTGTPPPAGFGKYGLYDAQRDRMLVFGPGLPVYQLALAGTPAWSIAYPSLAPLSARSGASYLLDPIRDRVLIFGGEGLYSSVRYDDSYALDLPTGVVTGPLSIAGALPPVRALHAAVFQPSRDRMVIVGGGSQYSNYPPLDDTWFLTGDMPTPVLASLVSSGWDGRGVHLAWQVAAVGSTELSVQRNDGGATWRLIATPHADAHGLVSVRDDGVQSGRDYRYRLMDGTAVLDETAVRIPASTTRLALESIAPSPMDREGWFSFLLPLPGEVRWELVDLGGRRRGLSSQATLPAGRHTLQLSGIEALPPGVYWLRLTVGEASRQRAFLVHR